MLRAPQLEGHMREAAAGWEPLPQGLAVPLASCLLELGGGGTPPRCPVWQRDVCCVTSESH